MTDTHRIARPETHQHLPKWNRGHRRPACLTRSMGSRVSPHGMSFWVANTRFFGRRCLSRPDVLAIAKMGNPPGVLPARHHGPGQHQ